MSEVERRGGSWRVVLGKDDEAREGDCRDCLYLTGHVTWWCQNEEAVRTHGTNIPGRTRCEFWREPLRKG